MTMSYLKIKDVTYIHFMLVSAPIGLHNISNDLRRGTDYIYRYLISLSTRGNIFVIFVAQLGTYIPTL